jgi:phosphatidylserine/phosphatidylglycerophosphate/cardiolipin synthase-like enzyme
VVVREGDFAMQRTAAIFVDHWATVGSSNLDPLSLSLNLEANLIIHDRVFNQTHQLRFGSIVLSIR